MNIKMNTRLEEFFFEQHCALKGGTIFRTFQPNAEECTFFSSAHGSFSRMAHVLGRKSTLSKFKKIEIVSSVFSTHNAMRLDINYKKIKK